MVRLADKIRQADDRTETTIQVEEWGVKIGIRSMTARQRSDMQERWAEAGEQSASTLYENIILHCVFDPETGEAVFTEEDLEWLLEEKSAQVVDRIAQECLKVSGLMTDSVDEVGKGSLALVEETQS
jgi:hypothetical protein